MFDVRMFAHIQMFENSNSRMFNNIRMFGCSMFNFSIIQMLGCSLLLKYSNVRISNVRQYPNIKMFGYSLIFEGWDVQCSNVLVFFFINPCSRVRMFAEHERTFEHWTQMFNVRWPLRLGLLMAHRHWFYSKFRLLDPKDPCVWNIISIVEYCLSFNVRLPR